MCTPLPPFLPERSFIRMVEFLMNTVESFRNRHQLARENAQLRQQLSDCENLAEENAQLRNELTRQRHPPAAKAEQMGADEITTSQSEQYTHLPESMFEVYQPPAQNPQLTAAPSPDPPQNNERAALEAQVNQYRQEHSEILERYEKLAAEMKKKKIESFEELAEHDKESMKIFIELARLTPPMPLQGNNIGLFGVTSTGKSTMLNAILGQQLAETGVGETTTEIKAYPANGFTLWDVPGRNDEVSYLSMEYVSFFKGLTQRLILIQATVKENSSMMKLLDQLDLNYSIVFNKFDKVDEEEQPLLRTQIPKEIKTINLQKVGDIFFVSAKNPKMFEDWQRMIDHLN